MYKILMMSVVLITSLTASDLKEENSISENKSVRWIPQAPIKRQKVKEYWKLKAETDPSIRIVGNNLWFKESTKTIS